MQHKHLADNADTLAPDGSAVRYLVRGSRGEVNHFTLPPHTISAAVAHKSIEEIWYFLSGQGEMWRKNGDDEEVLPVGPGVSIDIPTGTHFQFRNTGDETLCFVITTMPPWPGDDEAYPVAGPWPT